MSLQFDNEKVDLVSPILAAINAGEYSRARLLLHQITDKETRQAVRYTVATKTQVLL